MTAPSDPRLQGRHPEFARMSLKPGIGGDAVHEMASAHLEHDIVKKNGGDVITSLRHGQKIMPLGRYLTRRLRLHVGMDAKAPECTLKAQQAKMQTLQEAAASVTNTQTTRFLRKTVFKNLIIDSNLQKHRNMEARSKIFKKRGTL